MSNYAKSLPKDKGGNTMQHFNVPYPALTTTVSATAVSSLLSLNENATVLEVASPNDTVGMKWITIGNTNPSVITVAGTANFDHVIPAGEFRQFVIPVETQGAAGPMSVSSMNGLYQRVAFKPVGAGVASVLVTQY